MQVCKPWTNVSLDFAGPVVIKGDVNVRSRSKSWILVIVCRNTKAVCLLATIVGMQLLTSYASGKNSWHAKGSHKL